MAVPDAFQVHRRPVDYLYEKVITATGRTFTGLLQRAHNGQYANYLAWTVGGLGVVVWIILQLLK